MEGVFGNDPKLLETEFNSFKSFLRLDFYTYDAEKSTPPQQLQSALINQQSHIVNRTPSSPTCFKVVGDCLLDESVRNRLPQKIADLKLLIEALIAQTVLFYYNIISLFFIYYTVIRVLNYFIDFYSFFFRL